METILTQEQKKILRKTCNYLASLGMSDGLIEFEVEGDDWCNDINWESISHFENNYTAEIPEFLIPILEQIVNHICENSLFNYPDVDDINYQRISIDIDCERKELSVNHDYSYYESSDTDSIEFSLESDGDDESLVELFDVLEDDNDITSRELQLDYNGSGDSGYIEDSFTNGDSVPGPVEDFCYRQLENHFGGWEINEGSQGNFQIDLDKKTVVLNHTSNLEQNSRDTIYEEKF